MPWICGDNTMLEQIERKRILCKEIRSRQHPKLQKFLERPPPPPPDKNEDRHQERNQCKQESWGKNSGAKKIRPPPYPTQKTVFWDTAIWQERHTCTSLPNNPKLTHFLSPSHWADSLPKHQGARDSQKRAPGVDTRWWCQRTMAVTIAIFLLVQVVMFSYHCWWYLIFFYFLWLDSCTLISRIDIWWIDIF